MIRGASTIDEPGLATIIQGYHDVTERLMRSHELLKGEVCRLRDELHEKNEQLQRAERLAALGEMAAGVAHEIRNPLGGIGLYASLLERELDDRPREQNWVQCIRTGVGTLESVVGDILAFSGGHAPRFQPVRLEEIIDTVVMQTAPRSRSQSIEVVVGAGLNGTLLACDPHQAERALLNLVFNALDAAGQNGHVWIRPGNSHPHDTLYPITIEDDGPGIEPAMLHRVFNPFFTTKASGTGLGLAIVHRIAESHGGSVTAGNRPEGGARFVLSLPLSVTDGPESPAEEKDKR